jgi:hypothetical protein
VKKNSSSSIRLVLNSPQAQAGGAWHIRSALQRIAGSSENVDAFCRRVV